MAVKGEKLEVNESLLICVLLLPLLFYALSLPGLAFFESALLSFTQVDDNNANFIFY